MTTDDVFLAGQIRDACLSLLALASQMEAGVTSGKEANEWAGADAERLLSYVNAHGDTIDWDAES